MTQVRKPHRALLHGRAAAVSHEPRRAWTAPAAVCEASTRAASQRRPCAAGWVRAQALCGKPPRAGQGAPEQAREAPAKRDAGRQQVHALHVHKSLSKALAPARPACTAGAAVRASSLCRCSHCMILPHCWSPGTGRPPGARPCRGAVQHAGRSLALLGPSVLASGCSATPRKWAFLTSLQTCGLACGEGQKERRLLLGTARLRTIIAAMIQVRIIWMMIVTPASPACLPGTALVGACQAVQQGAPVAHQRVVVDVPQQHALVRVVVHACTAGRQLSYTDSWCTSPGPDVRVPATGGYHRRWRTPGRPR